MVAASLLTCLALAGVVAGILMGESRRFSANLAAAGGGLLSGIALFWLLPEIAAMSSWVGAALLTVAACLAIASLDRYLSHRNGRSQAGLIGPLLAATGVHSLLDGWSVRAAPAEPIGAIAVSLGLALHKVPEGLALGWVTRRSVVSLWMSLGLAVCVESLTLLGAWLEPKADRTGIEQFGIWWMAIVLAVISGSFLFLGLHAVLPARRKAGVISFFATTFFLAGLVALLNRTLLHS